MLVEHRHDVVPAPDRLENGDCQHDASYIPQLGPCNTVVHFTAQECEADLSQKVGYVNEYPYKDAQGHDSFIHLKPNQVAGVFITRPATSGEQVITYTVA